MREEKTGDFPSRLSKLPVSCKTGVRKRAKDPSHFHEQHPIPDISFDYMLLVTTICFVDDIVQAFAQAYRVLKPGGCTIVGFVDRESELGLVIIMEKALLSGLRGLRRLSKTAPPVKCWTKATAVNRSILGIDFVHTMGYTSKKLMEEQKCQILRQQFPLKSQSLKK